MEGDYEEAEIDEVGKTSGNHAADTIVILQNHFKNIKKSDVEPALNTIDDYGIEEDTTNDNLHQPSTDVDSNTSFENVVDGRDA